MLEISGLWSTTEPEPDEWAQHTPTGDGGAVQHTPTGDGGAVQHTNNIIGNGVMCTVHIHQTPPTGHMYSHNSQLYSK